MKNSIRPAEKRDILALCALWKTCFHDSDDYIRLFYRENFDRISVPVFTADDMPVSMLHLFDVDFLNGADTLPAKLIYAAGTLPAYRQQGGMGLLLEAVTGEFRFVNAGHEPPFIRRADGGFELHKIKSGFVLAGMEDMRYRSGVLTLSPGESIFLYTDGVTEATDAEDRLFGMERLETSLNKVPDPTPENVLPAIKADIDAFVGDVPQFDDITMLCLSYMQPMEEE